jgi:O-antigen/teichoic acid export membrane protein
MGLSAISPNLVPLVLGEKWLAAIPLIECMGICGITMALVMTLEPLLVASGRARIFATFQWIQLLILAPALIHAGKVFGIVSVAAAKTIILTLSLPIWFYVVSRIERISARRLLEAVVPATLAGVGMYVGVRAVAKIPIPSEVLILISQLLAGACLYLMISWSIWRARGYPDGAERQALNRLRGVWHVWQRRGYGVSS